MEVYRYYLQFEDYVFYATNERGKVFETGWFIHNYALTYALGLALSNYREEKQKADYLNQFQPLNQAGIYLTPAQVLDTTRYLINQFNTIDETFTLKREQSVGYPAWGFAKMFRPLANKLIRDKSGNVTYKSNAMGYLICHDSLTNSLANLRQQYQIEDLNLLPIQYLRLGKFMAKVKMTLEKATSVKLVNQSQPINGMLNWSDLLTKPQLFDLIASALPTRLLESARYLTPTPLLQVNFESQSETVYLPQNMSYLGGM